MSAYQRTDRRKPIAGAAALGIFAFGVIAYGGPRSDKASSKNLRVQNLKAVKIEPPIEGPLAIPPALAKWRSHLEPLPQGMPIVTYQISVDKTGGVAAGGSFSALVFLDHHDSAFFQPIKSSDRGPFPFTPTSPDASFQGVERRFGNGWTPGDSINGYSLLVYNSVANSGTATLVASLWDGDPLGITFTRCSPTGIPAPIPGTTVTFADLPQAPSLCPSILVDARACLGLFELKASFPKVQVNCDRVYQVYTLDAGCRLGWRLGGSPGSLVYSGPTIGLSDLIEQSYECGQFGGCNNATGNGGPHCDAGSNAGLPCNADGECPGGVCLRAFCCHDPSVRCDHGSSVTTCQGGVNADAVCAVAADCCVNRDCATDPDPGVCSIQECAQHITSCTTGVVDSATAFSFGGLFPGQTVGYFASFAGSVTAATDAAISLVEHARCVGGSRNGLLCNTDADCPAVVPTDPDESCFHSGNSDIILGDGGQGVLLDMVLSDFDPGQTGIGVRAWQAQLSSAGFSSGLAGTLTPWVPDCAANGVQDCVDAYGLPGAGGGAGGLRCGFTGSPTGCTPTFSDNSRDDYLFCSTLFFPGGGCLQPETLTELGGSDPVHLRAGSTLRNGLARSVSNAHYLLTQAVFVPTDARGTFTLKPSPERGDNSILTDQGLFLPLLGLNPATITVPIGRCCDLSSQPFVCISDAFTPNECAAAGGNFSPGKTCNDGCPPPKNRYLSFTPSNPGRQTALRVTLLSAPDAPGSVGSQWWVAPPVVYCENSGQATPDANGRCGPSPGLPDRFMSSRLQCSRHCMDWGSLSNGLHIGDINVVPNAVYEIQAVACDGDTNPFLPLTVTTVRVWGDVDDGCQSPACECELPNGVINVTTDVTDILNKFRNINCALSKARADLEPGDVDRKINIPDVTDALNAFRSNPYPFPQPVGCPAGT